MFLGVDLGTSSVKLLLADGEGRILGQRSTEYPISYPYPHWSEQNPEDWWNGFCRALAALGAAHRLDRVTHMSFSGQMHGLVLLDEEDKVIRPALLWNDGRTADECDYLNGEIGKEKLIAWTGNVALAGFTAPKVLWVRRHEPENFSRAARLMLPKDYIAYRLTGAFATDVSDASGTLFFDVKNRRWSQPMLDVLGIREDQLPKVYESGDIIGSVRAETAAALGLSPDTRVVIGGGDQAMGAIGAGAVHAGAVSVNLGTSGVVFINSGGYVESGEALHSFCNACGAYHLMGVTLSCAGSTKWWAEDVLQTNDYAALFQGLKELPIDSLIYLPYLMGERSPVNDPHAQGILYGLNAAHDRKAVTKAILEGVCFSLYDCVRAARAGGTAIDAARVIGGGSRSEDWVQMLADVMGIPLSLINTSEGGALGALLLCMVAAGNYKDIPAACEALITVTHRFEPNAEKHEAYQKKFALYKRVYEQNCDAIS
ncbi:MAG: xylulokinase [Eubacteriales bacterium]|nr:xylulokinase [Eubacteriales bacterium]